jgi:hypothetical protein
LWFFGFSYKLRKSVQRLQERVLEMLQQLDSGLDIIYTNQVQQTAAKGYVSHYIHMLYRYSLAESIDDGTQRRNFSPAESSR